MSLAPISWRTVRQHEARLDALPVAVHKVTTTNDTPTELVVFTLEAGSVAAYDAQVIALGPTKTGVRRHTVEATTDGDNTPYAGSGPGELHEVTDNGDPTGWFVEFAEGAAESGEIRVLVTGEAATTIQWAMSVVAVSLP